MTASKLLLAVSMIACFSIGFTLKCYQCEVAGTDLCTVEETCSLENLPAETKNTTLAQDLKEDNLACSKIVLKPDLGTYVTKRSCNLKTLMTMDFCHFTRASSMLWTEHCSLCFTDLCNDTIRLTPILFIYPTFLLIFMVWGF